MKHYSNKALTSDEVKRRYYCYHSMRRYCLRHAKLARRMKAERLFHRKLRKEIEAKLGLGLRLGGINTFAQERMKHLLQFNPGRIAQEQEWERTRCENESRELEQIDLRAKEIARETLAGLV